MITRFLSDDFQMQFLGDRLQNGSPHAIVPLSVLSVCPDNPVTLVYCGQTVWWISMKLGTEIGLGLGHDVLDGDPDPPPSKKGEAQPPPQFSAHVCCG